MKFRIMESLNLFTFMLVTRGPKAFFIQDIRSSACSCVRRSEAAEDERQQTRSQDYGHDSESCPATLLSFNRRN